MIAFKEYYLEEGKVDNLFRIIVCAAGIITSGCLGPVHYLELKKYVPQIETPEEWKSVFGGSIPEYIAKEIWELMQVKYPHIEADTSVGIREMHNQFVLDREHWSGQIRSLLYHHYKKNSL